MRTAALVVALPLCAAAIVVFPLTALLALGLGALVGLAVFVLVHGSDASGPPQSRGRAVAAGRDAAGVVAAATLLLTGAAVALGSATTPVILLLVAATAPWIWRRRGRLGERYRPRPTAQESPATEDTDRPSGEVATDHCAPRGIVSVPTPALCARWQAGYHALQHNADPRAWDTILQSRRECLDELERRDPAGVARWLANETRPGSTSPHRYLTRHAPSN